MAEETKVIEIPAKFQGLVSEIEKMSVLDLAELVKVLEEKFGVSAMAAPTLSVGAPTPPMADVGEEQTTFNVELTETGGNKIGVIKVLREITQLGLKDAKDLVDTAPKMVKEGVGKAEAETMKKKIEEAGGKVTLK